MKTRLHPVLALVIASFVGCAIFVLILPWGDPCSFHHPCQFTAAHNAWSNASFVVICLAVGFVAGKLSRSYRPLVGALSVPVAGVTGAVMARVVYRLGTPHFDIWAILNAPDLTGLYVGVSALLVLGAIGAVASMWLSARSFKPRPPSGA